MAATPGSRLLEFIIYLIVLIALFYYVFPWIGRW
jgi:hypothetical protein